MAKSNTPLNPEQSSNDVWFERRKSSFLKILNFDKSGNDLTEMNKYELFEKNIKKYCAQKNITLEDSDSEFNHLLAVFSNRDNKEKRIECFDQWVIALEKRQLEQIFAASLESTPKKAEEGSEDSDMELTMKLSLQDQVRGRGNDGILGSLLARQGTDRPLNNKDTHFAQDKEPLCDDNDFINVLGSGLVFKDPDKILQPGTHIIYCNQEDAVILKMLLEAILTNLKNHNSQIPPGEIKLLIPISDRSHWRLAIVDINKLNNEFKITQTTLWDSMYLLNEQSTAAKVMREAINQATMRFEAPKVRQNNVWSCGDYVMQKCLQLKTDAHGPEFDAIRNSKTPEALRQLISARTVAQYNQSHFPEQGLSSSLAASAASTTATIMASSLASHAVEKKSISSMNTIKNAANKAFTNIYNKQKSTIETTPSSQDIKEQSEIANTAPTAKTNSLDNLGADLFAKELKKATSLKPKS